MSAQSRAYLLMSSRVAPCRLPVAHASRSFPRDHGCARTSCLAPHVLEPVLGCYYSTGSHDFPKPISFYFIPARVG